jgi:hypothetical protein
VSTRIPKETTQHKTVEKNERMKTYQRNLVPLTLTALALSAFDVGVATGSFTNAELFDTVSRAWFLSGHLDRSRPGTPTAGSLVPLLFSGLGEACMVVGFPICAPDRGKKF